MASTSPYDNELLYLFGISIAIGEDCGAKGGRSTYRARWNALGRYQARKGGSHRNERRFHAEWDLASSRLEYCSDLGTAQMLEQCEEVRVRGRYKVSRSHSVGQGAKVRSVKEAYSDREVSFISIIAWFIGLSATAAHADCIIGSSVDDRPSFDKRSKPIGSEGFI